MAGTAQKRLNRAIGTDIAIFTVLALLSLLMVLPMVYIISNAFKPLDEMWAYPPRFFVRNPTLKNFSDLFAAASISWIPFSRYVFNTALISAAGTAGNVIVSSLCAYPLAKRRFPGSKPLFGVIVTALMFNPAVTSIPNYFILSKIRLVDSYWAIILPAVAMPLGLYLMKQFMEQMVPDSLIEAAKIDGAPERVVFWKLIMPIVKPAWLTLILFSFQSLWAVSNTPLLRSEQFKTMQYALLTLKDSGLTRAGAYSAGAFLMLLVPITIFLVTQSNILETMATSGMKD